MQFLPNNLLEQLTNPQYLFIYFEDFDTHENTQKVGNYVGSCMTSYRKTTSNFPRTLGDLGHKMG